MVLSSILDIIAAELDPEMPLQQIRAFLIVARGGGDGVPRQQIERELKFSPTAITRITQKLASEGYMTAGKREPGYGVIEQFRNPQNYRETMFKLSTKGERLLSKIAARLERK